MSTVSVNPFRIFVCYRRDDDAYAGRIYDRLVQAFGKQRVFMDIEGIKAGEDFEKIIQDSIKNCEVLLVLIGKDWLKTKTTLGRIKLADPNDFVRLEIRSALRFHLRIIPVLLSPAKMPEARQVPVDIEELAKYQAITVSSSRFDTEIANVVDAIQNAVARELESSQRIVDDKPISSSARNSRWMAAVSLVLPLMCLAVIAIGSSELTWFSMQRMTLLGVSLCCAGLVFGHFSYVYGVSAGALLGWIFVPSCVGLYVLDWFGLKYQLLDTEEGSAIVFGLALAITGSWLVIRTMKRFLARDVATKIQSYESLWTSEICGFPDRVKTILIVYAISIFLMLVPLNGIRMPPLFWIVLIVLGAVIGNAGAWTKVRSAVIVGWLVTPTLVACFAFRWIGADVLSDEDNYTPIAFSCIFGVLLFVFYVSSRLAGAPERKTDVSRLQPVMWLLSVAAVGCLLGNGVFLYRPSPILLNGMRVLTLLAIPLALYAADSFRHRDKGGVAIRPLLLGLIVFVVGCTGSLTGVILDPSGAVIAGAVINVGAYPAITTNSEGRFTALLIPTAPYTWSAGARSFRSVSVENDFVPPLFPVERRVVLNVGTGQEVMPLGLNIRPILLLFDVGIILAMIVLAQHRVRLPANMQRPYTEEE